MTEALEPAGWTIYGTRCECPCHHTPGIRHFMACCSSEKRDTPMTKSILSEQREADEERCEWLLTIAAECRERNPWGSAASAIESAVARIRALSEALQEACHERDGLLAKVERHAS